MRLSEFNECLYRLRKIYPFKDEQADVDIVSDIRTVRRNVVEVRAFDEETQVDIRLEAKPQRDESCE